MSLDTDIPYCFDLPTIPRPEIGKILVTGATGYIGGRLVQELKIRGYEIRILVRSESPEDDKHQAVGVEVVVGDALDYNSISTSMKDVTVVYYLIHSLLPSKKELERTEIKAAANFRRAAEENQVDRIVFLGRLDTMRNKPSVHLRDRLRVADELTKGKVPVTILRASMIIGSGSASFEILENLVKKLPVILIPKWARSKSQPIGIRDIIKYLVGVLEKDETIGNAYDIGGKNKLHYIEMLRILAGLLGKKRIYINCFISKPFFYSYFTSLITPLPTPIVLSLFEGAKNEVVCLNDNIKKVIDFELLSYSEAIVFALDREDQDKVRTRWSDAYPPSHELAIKMHELGIPKYISSYSLTTKKSSSSLFSTICKVGGNEGWFQNNWMWNLRGMIDSMIMGVGTSRGRRSFSSLRINDVIGFWRVEDLHQDERLLLRAEMKLPGKAWLEFKISNLNDHDQNQNKLSVTAFFHHKGILGKVYWYLFVPFHFILFKDLLKDIENKS